MKIQNPEVLQQNNNLEPFQIAPDYIFFNYLRHALKKKYVYVSKHSIVEMHNTQRYNLDVLFGSKFFRKLKISLGGKTVSKKSRFNNKNRNIDSVESIIRFQPLVLKLKKKKSLLLLKLKTLLSLYKKKLNSGEIKKNKFLKKLLSNNPEIRKRLSFLTDKSAVGLVNSVIYWLRLGLQSTISGSKLYRYCNLNTYLKHERKFFIKNNSFLNKYKAAVNFNLHTNTQVISLRAELYDQFYKGFISQVKESLEKQKENFRLRKIRSELSSNKQLLSFDTQKNILSLNKSNNIEKNIHFNMNPINNKVYKPIYREFFNELNLFKFGLFPRNALFFLDFIAMLSLLSRREVSLEVFGNALSSILGSIHKRKHGTFISLLTTLSKKVVETKDSLISGIRFLFSGRIFGNSMAKTSLIGAGSLELNTIDASTDHVVIDAFTVYGVFGIQIWVTYKPKTIIEDYPDYKEIMKQQERIGDEDPQNSVSIKQKNKKITKLFESNKAFLRYLLQNEEELDDFSDIFTESSKKVQDKANPKHMKNLENSRSLPKNIEIAENKILSKFSVEKDVISQQKEASNKKNVGQQKSSESKKKTKNPNENSVSDTKPEISKKEKINKTKDKKIKNK